MDDTYLSVLSLVISAAAAVVAYLAWKTTREQSLDALWTVRFAAYKDIETEANTNAFLTIHGISERDLRDHGLTKDTFRAYLVRINAMWTSGHKRKGHRRIRKAKSYEQKVRIARDYTWDKDNASGRLIRSEEFERAWPLIRRFWNTSGDCVMAALIEAGVALGIEDRKKQQRPPGASVE